MSTGVGLLLSVIPTAYRFPGLTTIGIAIFVMNLFFFTIATITISIRFIIHPGALTQCSHQPARGFLLRNLLA